MTLDMPSLLYQHHIMFIIHMTLNDDYNRRQCICNITFISGCPWMAITTPDNVYCTYDSMCLGVECCLNVKLFMFLYTVKAYARYDPCDYTLSVGLQGYNYTIKFDMGYDGKST